MKISDIEVNAVHPERWGDDLDVVNAARVSFEKESDWELVQFPDWHEQSGDAYYKLSDADAKLIRYLAKHKHHSPFNHSFLSFKIKAPIFVARQLVKHKFMPWNEVSRRYVDSEPEFYFPEYWRKKAENVKQGSSSQPVDALEKYCEDAAFVANEAYNRMLQEGVCPEQARMVLPQNMMTEWRWSGSLGAFLDMLVLRLDPHTQKESRIVAQKIYELVKEKFPVSTEAYLGTVYDKA